MAVGQLADYTWLVEHSDPRPLLKVKGEVVLLGEEPSAATKCFLECLNLAIVWERDNAFFDHPPGSVV